MPGQHRGARSPFYIRPGTREYCYSKPERFKIVRTHLQRDVMKGRKPSTVEEVALAHAAALLVDLHQDLKAFEDGRKLPADHLRRMTAFRTALDGLRPKAPPKSGATGTAESFGLADIVKSGGGS